MLIFIRYVSNNNHYILLWRSMHGYNLAKVYLHWEKLRYEYRAGNHAHDPTMYAGSTYIRLLELFLMFFTYCYCWYYDIHDDSYNYHTDWFEFFNFERYRSSTIIYCLLEMVHYSFFSQNSLRIENAIGNTKVQIYNIYICHVEKKNKMYFMLE